MLFPQATHHLLDAPLGKSNSPETSSREQEEFVDLVVLDEKR
jgi:hypothetical protein